MRFHPAVAAMLLAATADYPPERVARTATPWRDDPPKPKALAVRIVDPVPPPRPASRQVQRANARREEYRLLRQHGAFRLRTRSELRQLARVRAAGMVLA